MKKTFVYKKQASVSIWPALAFAVIAALCVIFKYGITISTPRVTTATSGKKTGLPQAMSLTSLKKY